MNEATEVAVKAALALVAVAAILHRHLRPGRLPERRAGRWLVVVAALAALAWTNFGTFHGGRLAHRWEQFHYFLGAKYFPELGYDGLYVASLGAQLQIAGGDRMVQPYLRDLRTNRVEPTDSLGGLGLEVRQRFSEARWSEFRKDNAYFLNAGDYEYLRQIRLDHGYNPSPLWTFVAQLFAGHVAASDGSTNALATLDLALLALLFWSLGRTYGSRITCLALIILGLGYAWRWDWIGGAFLRQDWLVAVGLGICALATRRYASAGALLAYAGLVRVFPFALMLGPAVLALRAWRQGGDSRWVRRLAGGFATMLLLGLGAGSLAGRGPRAWMEFAHDVGKHERAWLTNNVGAKLALLYGPDTFERKLVDPKLPDSFAPWEAAMTERADARRAALVLLMASLLGLAALAAWYSSLDESVVLGWVAIFALSALTGYYWELLAVVPVRGPFRRSGWSAAALVALSGVLFLVHRVTNVFERLYGALSWALLLFAVAWLLPEAWQRWRLRSTASPSETRSSRGAR